MVATAAGNKVSAFGGDLKTVASEHLGTNKYVVGFLCLLKSQSLVHGYLLSTYNRVLSAMRYGARVVQTI